MQLSPEEEIEVRSCLAAIEIEERKKDFEKKEKELKEKEEKLIQMPKKLGMPPWKQSGWLASYS